MILIILYEVILCTVVNAFVNKKKITLTDVAGRTIVLHIPVQRIILGDGTFAYTLALLKPDHPFSKVIAWGDNFRFADLAGYMQYQEKFPEISEIKTFSGKSQDAINSELAISLNPDIVILGLSSLTVAQSSNFLDKMQMAGIPIVFIDFRAKMFANTANSIRIMGKILGCDKRAQNFLDFRQQQIEQVTKPLKHIHKRPIVMVERAAGFYKTCCLSYGNNNFGELVALAGGENLGTKFLHEVFGKLHPEQVIASNPEAVLLTGADWSLYNCNGAWINLGPGTNLNESRSRLENLMKRPAYKSLEAVKRGKVYAIWHAFYDNPSSFIALQQIAKWLHPEIFSSLNPEKTFQELHRRFLPIPYKPGYWLSLESK